MVIANSYLSVNQMKIKSWSNIFQQLSFMW